MPSSQTSSTLDDVVCLHCLKVFSRRDDRNRHIKESHLKENMIECPGCKRKMKKRSWRRHIRQVKKCPLYQGPEKKPKRDRPVECELAVVEDDGGMDLSVECVEVEIDLPSNENDQPGFQKEVMVGVM